MSRFRNSWNGEAYKPGPIAVGDSDYGYITNQQISDGDIFGSPSEFDGSTPPPADDVLIFAFDGQTRRSCFPPYCISDGKLQVGDIRSRAGILFGIDGDPLKNATLKYKGKDLAIGDYGEKTPVNHFGVKNRSEIALSLPESDDDRRGSGKKKSKKPKKKRTGNDSETDSATPQPVGKGATPLDQVNVIEKWFNDELEKMCRDFIKAPPSDPKKRDQEWRRLSETTMQHVTLKLDAVEPNGDAQVRARRKEVTKRVEMIMRELDDAKNSK